ncbi:MAG: HlyD family efflux transporter periplasmic adaptor subunit [Candidatus Omnitrophica bacterium]|nr:HlyD family efflux transporter periplasmic adaptor subunit [Candidatus Omnitrophota bacterium]
MRILIVLLAVALISGCSGKNDFKHMIFSGTMEMTEHVLGVKAAGRLTTLNVKEGDKVQKGQLLATFDRFEQNKKDYERVGVLYQNGGANQQSLENAKLAMEDQQVISPLYGVVLVKSAQTGEIIPAGGGVVVVGDPFDQWVKIFVSEDLMHQLSINQTASITVDGSDRTYKGHVTFIADKAEFTPRNVQTPEERVTQTFAVKIAVDDADDHLHAGVAADVKFN